MLTAIIAFVLDAAIGDPRTRLHPVAIMGSFVAFLEKILYREKLGDGAKLFAGAVLAAVALATAYFSAWLFVSFAAFVGERTEAPFVAVILNAFFLSFMIAPKSLAQAGQEIYALLMAENIEGARKKVGMIVGRDTDRLDAGEITRATVETIAENTVDGVISPLFFFAVGGVPLAAFYRMANTLDSMLGYKNEKYLFFGRAAARIDDMLNYIPARITGLLFVAAAWLLKYDHHYALTIMKRDADKHPSPNGGQAEAAVAGALHIRLGGVNYYFGKKSFRAYMGDAMEKLQPKHIRAATMLMQTASVLFLALAYVACEIYR